MSENYCNTCTLCCKLMSVIELNKPRCVWCKHIASNKNSCTIYEERPEGCKEWTCGWFSSQRSAIPLPAEMRPDRSHVVISRGVKSIWFHCDPDYPDAWQKGNTHKLINNLVNLNNYPVYVVIGNKRLVLQKNKPIMTFTDNDAFANYSREQSVIREKVEEDGKK